MILDLKDISGSPEFPCDICIVGSGAAGLALASELMRTPLKIMLLESGGLEFEAPSQALYDVDVTGLPFVGATEGRFRVHGGSTTRWGGQALPLLPGDFEPRAWVAHSGWPLRFEELTDYYRRAKQFLLVDEMNYDTDLFAHLRTRPPGFDAEKIWYHFSRWSPQPDVKVRYRSVLRDSQNCTLLLHANVTQIELSPGLNHVETIDVRALNGQAAKVRARVVVLCVGGIETARMLLANNRQQPGGIGNGHDLVGRYFQDHPGTAIGQLMTRDPANVQRLFNVFHKAGLKYSVRCTATPQLQRERRMLSASASVRFLEINSALQDLKDAAAAFRQKRFDRQALAKLGSAAIHPLAVSVPIYHFLAHGRIYSPGAKFSIGIDSEQEPNPESRILLSEKTDALGIPRANVRWKLTDLSHHTLREFGGVLRDEFHRAGIGEIQLEPWVQEDSTAWQGHVGDQNHHMGTARMNDDPRQGVVDRNCRVHGVENLYIASSAVFPTSGHSNPTLTMLALCMRLADRLRGI